MISYLIGLLPPLVQLGLQYLVVIAVCSWLFGFFNAIGNRDYWKLVDWKDSRKHK